MLYSQHQWRLQEALHSPESRTMDKSNSLVLRNLILISVEMTSLTHSSRHRLSNQNRTCSLCQVQVKKPKNSKISLKKSIVTHLSQALALLRQRQNLILWTLILVAQIKCLINKLPIDQPNSAIERQSQVQTSRVRVIKLKCNLAFNSWRAWELRRFRAI